MKTINNVLHFAICCLQFAVFIFPPLVGIKGGFAQQKNVVSAYNYYGMGELDNAKQYIDLATAHEQTSGKAKTWYYRGMIYHSIYESKDDRYKNLDPSPLQVTFVAYRKAVELDDSKQFTEDIQRRLLITGNQFINKGVNEFSSRNYSGALASFEAAVAISRMPLINKLDTLALYNAALAAEKAGNNDKAIVFYNDLIKIKYGGARTYFYLAKVYKAKKDTTMAMEKVREGRAIYPDDNNLLIEEINFYLQSGKNSEAIDRLKKAIEKTPDNHNLYYALGTTYDQIGDFNNSENAYRQGLALAEKYYADISKKYEESKGTENEAETKADYNQVREDYFNILYNLGALYYNDGVNKIKVANEIKDLTKYNAEKKAAEQIMLKALPYLEKALELNPRDINTLKSLKELYARMNDMVNYKRIDEMLKN